MAAQVEQQRPRSKSMLSFGSGRSRKSSGGSGTKLDLTENAKEKASRRMTSKANPTTALNEAQPATQALDKSTLESIRSVQHRDIHGNIITDPDRSNPTRPRFERPLDTIRSFEAAIDGSYNRRFSARPETQDFSIQSRRSSAYMSGYNVNQQRYPGTPGDASGYYGNRMSAARPDSYIENHSTSPAHHQQVRRFGPRTQSDPALYGIGNNSHTVYPTHGYQQSYDTVTSATPSHGTDQWGNSTDPSSENSSVDKIHQAPKPDLGETYGFNGFGGAPKFPGPILEEHGKNAPAYGQPGYGQSHSVPGAGYAYQGNSVAPAPPPHTIARESAPRVPIKLGNPSGAPSQVTTLPHASPPAGSPGEKRKSWLKRRFSKKN